MITMQLYEKQSNRIYNKRPNSDTLYWLDASISTNNVTRYEIKKNAETMLGYPCDAIVLTTRTGTMIRSLFFKRGGGAIAKMSAE